MADAAVKKQTAPVSPLRKKHDAADSKVTDKLISQLATKHETQPKERKSRSRLVFKKHVKSADRMLLLDNLSTMLGAGLGITDALSILSEEIKNKQLKEVLENVRHGIEIGKSFSDGLELYPHIFPSLITSTIRVGEVSGTLVEVLARLAEMARRENQLKRKVIGALMYPTVVVFAMIVVGVIMLTYVFPQIVGVFVESDIKLPKQIIFINWMGDFLRAYGFYLLGGFFLIGIGLYFLMKVRNVRKKFDRLIIKIPLVGTKIIKGAIIARIALNLRTMLTSGLPIVDGIKTIAKTIGNLEYKDHLVAIAGEVEVGRSIHDSLAARPHLFNPIVIRMVKVGEGTGKLDDILQKLGMYYEDKVNDILGNISTIIEPALLLVVGVVVGFIAVSIIGPIYEIANNI